MDGSRPSGGGGNGRGLTGSLQSSLEAFNNKMMAALTRSPFLETFRGVASLQNDWPAMSAPPQSLPPKTIAWKGRGACSAGFAAAHTAARPTLLKLSSPSSIWSLQLLLLLSMRTYPHKHGEGLSQAMDPSASQAFNLQHQPMTYITLMDPDQKGSQKRDADGRPWSPLSNLALLSECRLDAWLMIDI
jgi:hypothetical protein